MERILTSAEARTVPLSRNPITRLAQLAELGSHVSGIRIGLSPLPRFMTRGALVRSLEIREKAYGLYDQIDNVDNSGIEGDSRSEEI